MSKYYTKTEIDTVMLSNHLSDIFENNGILIGANISGNWRNEVKFKTINGQKIIGEEGNIELPITDLTNYYNKTEVNALIDGLSTGGEVNLTNYYTKEEVDNIIPKNYLTSIPSEYVTETELNNKGYITSQYDDTALVNRISAIETELNGVQELITELNNMVV